ncbi:YibE/F family protein [Aeromicrobium sp.]|uniref:YibE/F family protein n=1 Tax=Aeromicrobium sp. TaxID=1871063 RepID=UPI003D6A8ACB
MGLTHTSTEVDYGRPRPVLAFVLVLVVLGIAAGAILGMVALWPDSDKVPRGQNPYAAEGVSTVDGKVTGVEGFDCDSGGEGPDQQPSVPGQCARVSASTADEKASFTLDPGRYRAGIEVGDDIRMTRIQPAGETASFEFLDFKRGLPLIALAIVFAVLVALVAGMRGLFSLVGIGVTLLALTKFMLPAMLAGESPLAVAVVGSTAIMIVVLYLAHGVSIRTTSALFGTFAGIGLTALIGLWSTGWTNLSGVGTEDDQALMATVPALDLSGVVAATMVIAGLGVLNDVTVTQASAVWELRALRPAAGRGAVFASAMRIGRDHIASSVYTLVFAYAGSAMTVLLLITAYQRDLAEIATTEDIGQEIARTLVGAIGLVLAVPVTTALAVLMASKPLDEDEVDERAPVAEPA